jgi:hypothetical protein
MILRLYDYMIYNPPISVPPCSNSPISHRHTGPRDPLSRLSPPFASFVLQTPARLSPFAPLR